MRWLIRGAVVLALAATVWEVYRVRTRLSSEDADPAAVAALRRNLDGLPREIEDGRYRGRDEPVPEEIVRDSGADSYIKINYRDSAGSSFQLYVGGSIRNRENFHAPSYCMPASGWELLEERTIPFDAYPISNDAPKMRRLRCQKGDDRMSVFYWFQAGDRLASHEWTIRFYRFLDLLADRPFRPTLIVTVYAPVTRSFAETERKALEFLRIAGPHVRDAILGEANGDG